MVCVAFLVCALIVLRRSQKGQPFGIPLAVMGLAVARVGIVAYALVHAALQLRDTNDLHPESKALLEASTSFVNFTVFIEAPLLGAAWLADAALRRRRARAAKPPPASVAAPGSHCAEHPSIAATHTCSRCGAFMCAACVQADGSQCAACLARVTSR